MPVACPNCGTQNPDGNNFCQSCGKPLSAPAPAAAPPPPAAAPPPPPAAAQAAPPPPGGPAMAPPPPPPGYQSPYYAPAQPTAVHRTPVGLIVGVIVGLLVLMGGCGVVIAAVAAHPKPSPSPVAHVSTPTPEPPTPVPSTAPTSGPTPRPTATPTPRATAPPTSGGQSISTKSFSLTAAPGMKVLKQDDFSVVLLTQSQDGTLFVQSGTLQNKSSTTDWVATVLADISKKYPDAQVCLKPKAENHGGQDGIIVGACYTYTPQNGSAYKAADVFWASVSSSNVLYVYEVFTTVDNFDNVYNKECLPVIDSINWKD